MFGGAGAGIVGLSAAVVASGLADLSHFVSKRISATKRLRTGGRLLESCKNSPLTLCSTRLAPIVEALERCVLGAVRGAARPYWRAMNEDP